MKRLLLLLTFLLISCQEGLDPTVQETSFVKGKLIVVSGRNSWPPIDSAIELRVVGFRDFPPKDLLNEIVSGNAFISDTLPRFLDTISYNLKIEKPPVEINYLVAALRYGTIFQWKVIGVYSDEMTYERAPKKIFVTKGKTIDNVNILIDFHNLPKQPFE
ncbi:MAG: hypothetical protein ACK42G_02165 [Candidatus Kapaibacteriota bacterium]